MRTSRKKKFSEFTGSEAFRALQIKHLLPWDIEYMPRKPSAFYHEKMRRLHKHFALSGSEEAKKLLIDAVCEEAMEGYDRLKIWKAAKLETEGMTGYADYLVAPNYDYLDLPLLCIVEAKKDDFEKGRAQCLVEMKACRENNEQRGLAIEVYGIVTNGEGWKCYRYDLEGRVAETQQVGLAHLEDILGQLSTIFAACEKQLCLLNETEKS